MQTISRGYLENVNAGLLEGMRDSSRFCDQLEGALLAEFLEAAIGIEPMNKGFAVSPGSCLYSLAVVDGGFLFAILSIKIPAALSKSTDICAVGTHLAHKNED